jgi:hypothetical protein
MGFDPSELCSFRGAVSSLDARCPPDVAVAGPTRHTLRTPSRAEPWFIRAGPSGSTTRAGASRLQGFAPLGSPKPSAGGLDRRRPAALLGLCLSRDPIPVPGPTIHTGQLPWAWPHGPCQRREAVGSFRVAALRSVPTRRLARSLSRSSAPHEVSHLVTPLGGSRAVRSELCVHFGPRATSPRSVEPSLDRHAVSVETGTAGC